MTVDRCREWKQDRADLAKCVDELERWRKIGVSIRILNERCRTNVVMGSENERLLREIVEDMPK